MIAAYHVFGDSCLLSEELAEIENELSITVQAASFQKPSNPALTQLALQAYSYFIGTKRVMIGK